MDNAGLFQHWTMLSPLFALYGLCWNQIIRNDLYLKLAFFSSICMKLYPILHMRNGNLFYHIQNLQTRNYGKNKDHVIIWDLEVLSTWNFQE